MRSATGRRASTTCARRRSGGARLYAEVLGLSLGRVLEISPEATPESAMADTALLRAAPAEGAGVAIPIAPGVQKLQAQARVVWELVQ